VRCQQLKGATTEATAMSRRSSIQTLLSESELQFEDIQERYVRSAERLELDPVVGVRIKNYCENLRSVLDYLANEIRERCCSGGGTNRYYFPIIEKKKFFDARMKGWFPGLSLCCPEVFSYLYSVQPLRHRRPPPYLRWLWHFNRLNNAGKHDDLVIHTTLEAPPERSGRLGGYAIQSERGRWTEIRFRLPRKNAVVLLWQALEGIHEIEINLAPMLGERGY